MGIPLLWSAAIMLVLPAAAPFEEPDPVPAYVTRGRQMEIVQRAFYERLERFYQALSEHLRRSSPDLLPRLTPPPLAVTGYQIVPRVVPDAAPPSPPPKPQVISYSWRWSETLIEKETGILQRLEADLAQASRSTAGLSVDEKLVTNYAQIVAHRRMIDADVQYNWLWQAQIDRNRDVYDRLTKLQQKVLARQNLDAALATNDDAKLRAVATDQEVDGKQSIESLRSALAERAQSLGSEILAQTGRADPPLYLGIESPAPHQWVVTVPVYTDIADADFLESFRGGVEAQWQARQGEDEYRVRLAIETISPECLYCGSPEGETPGCIPPVKGDKIDLQAHAKRFPEGGAVLTTGASTTHVTAGRAIVLGPHDVTPRLLAHEMGHLLGFEDTYVRGYRNLGVDGYQVTELVVDPFDIMGNSKAGSIQYRHFEKLIAVRDIKITMQTGLAALYERNDPVEASARFREVLERNPTHYGATFQLAKALDQSGETDEALALWKKVLEMAEAVHDPATAGTARARLVRAGWNLSPPVE